MKRMVKLVRSFEDVVVANIPPRANEVDAQRFEHAAQKFPQRRPCNLSRIQGFRAILRKVTRPRTLSSVSAIPVSATNAS